MAKKIVVPEFIAKYIGKDMVIPELKGGRVLGVIVLLLIGLGAWTTFYTVEPEQVGVVLRFGKLTKNIAQPGLHFKLPYGIDHVERVAILRQQKEEFGFRTEQAGVTSTFIDSTRDRSLLRVSLMVTGDLNAAVVEWIVQYRIGEPTDYLFNVRNPIETLRDAAESVTREVVGDRTVDEVLTIGRREIEVDILRQLQDLMNRYEMGIRIEQVVLQDVNPPEAVKASFNEVNQAQQEREKFINEARAEYNRVVPLAGGKAEQAIQEAEGYALERVNRAEGDAAKFNAVFAEYIKAPEVTRRRIYLETMQQVIPRLGRKIVIDEDVRQILPLLQLSVDGGVQP